MQTKAECDFLRKPSSIYSQPASFGKRFLRKIFFDECVDIDLSLQDMPQRRSSLQLGTQRMEKKKESLLGSSTPVLASMRSGCQVGLVILLSVS